MKNLQEKVGAKLRELRKSKGYNQDDIAKELGYSPMGISHFETGRRPLKVNDIEKLADFFGLHVEEFLGFYKEKELEPTLFRADSKFLDIEKVKKSLSEFNSYLEKNNL
jgi:transcriptional regulator with XRE-family HTH domain